MLGAIVGDIVGSVYEFDDQFRSKDFPSGIGSYLTPANTLPRRASPKTLEFHANLFGCLRHTALNLMGARHH